MITSGAYSKKYQAIEKNKMRDIREKERKQSKGRSHMLSIQTAQRQKAIEEKKLAMAAAEEERRKRVLEDRRRFQKQATERFRLALSRMKSSSKASVANGRNSNIEANAKVARCSHSHPNQVVADYQVKYGNHTTDNEQIKRVAIGKEVEIVPKRSPLMIGLQRKTHSLENVMDKAKDESGKNQNRNDACNQSTSNKTRNCTKSSASIQKSSSDTDLNVTKTSNSPESIQCRFNCDSARIEDCEDDMVFHPVNKKVTSENSCDLLVVSPDNCYNSHDDDISVICCSPTIPDSLNSSVTEINSKLNNTPRAFEEKPTNSQSHSEKQGQSDSKEYTEQPHTYLEEDSDVSINDSIEDCYSSSSSYPVVNCRLQSTVQSPDSDDKTVVVGILKKTTGSESPLNVSTMNYSRIIQETSCSGDDSPSRRTSSKSQKRVHFCDEININGSKSLVTNITDPVQSELWKNVVPKEFPPQPIRNSAFTPKMRCTLSPKSTSYQVNRIFKGSPFYERAVHIPIAFEEPFKPKEGINSEIEVEKTNRSDSGTPVTDVSDLTERSCVKTPADSEAASMWSQIRQCLQDGRKLSVPPRMFNFRPTSTNGKHVGYYRTVDTNVNSAMDVPKNNSRLLTKNGSNSTTTRKNGIVHTTQKHLVYRQPNPQSRLMRCHNELHSQPPSVIQEVALKNQPYHTVQSSSSKAPAKHENGSRKVSLTALSLEEQQLMQSIERLNERLKDHLEVSPWSDSAEPHTEYIYPVPPSTPPKKHKNGLRNNRVYYHQNPRPVTTNFQNYNNSRTHPLYKQVLHKNGQ